MKKSQFVAATAQISNTLKEIDENNTQDKYIVSSKAMTSVLIGASFLYTQIYTYMNSCSYNHVFICMFVCTYVYTGRGGSTIKEITSQSKAKIEISKESTPTLISIAGKEEYRQVKLT